MGKIKKALVTLLINKRIERRSRMFEKIVLRTNVDVNFPVDNETLELHKQKWSRLWKKDINLNWIRWYRKCNGIISPNFVPENIYYNIIEPILNDERYDMAFVEKNFYDIMYPAGIFPETIIKNIDGLYFDSNYKPLYLDDDSVLFNVLSVADRIVVKPSTETNGGRNVELYTLNDGQFVNTKGEPLTMKNLKEVYKQNFLIQKGLTQYPFTAFFNSTSINTFRVVTYRSDVTNKIDILHVVFRVGGKGQFLDNYTAGGYAIGVTPEGKLNKSAFRKDGTRYEMVNDINLSEHDFAIPLFDEIKETAKIIAERNIHHRMLSLDLLVDSQNNIRCIEINNKGNEVNFHQLNNGPLFGDFTDEVITYCEKNMHKLYRSYSVHI